MPQAQLLLELRRHLAAVLPDSLKSICSIANYKQGRVVIFATNGAVAAKLKLMRSGLAKQLSARGVQVTGIEIHVQPPESDTQVLVTPRQIGEKAAEALTQLQEQLPDSQLKSAVTRFLRRKQENM